MATKKKTETATKTRRRYNVTPEQIVEAWQTSHSVEEAVEKLGGEMNARALYSRVVTLRNKGVRLKSMNRAARYTPSYVDDLSELADSFVSNGN